jgi:hypothetical protein
MVGKDILEAGKTTVRRNICSEHLELYDSSGELFAWCASRCMN